MPYPPLYPTVPSPPLVIPCLTSLHSTTPSPPLYNPLTCLPSPLHYTIPSSLPYPTLSFTLPYPALLHSTLPSPPFTLLHSTSLYSTISPHPISSAHYPILPCNLPSPTPLHSCHYTRLYPALLFTLTYQPSHLQLHSTHVTTPHSTHPSPVPFPILPCALPYPTKLLFTLPYPAPLHSTTLPPPSSRLPYPSLSYSIPFQYILPSPFPVVPFTHRSPFILSYIYYPSRTPFYPPLHFTLPYITMPYATTFNSVIPYFSSSPLYPTLTYPNLPYPHLPTPPLDPPLNPPLHLTLPPFTRPLQSLPPLLLPKPPPSPSLPSPPLYPSLYYHAIPTPLHSTPSYHISPPLRFTLP